jgi:membrane-associated phospholipid phosphatase
VRTLPDRDLGDCVIVLAPGSPLWNLAQHAGWLTTTVIALTAACAVAAPLLVIAGWFSRAGLRCAVAALAALILVILIRHLAAAFWYVPRPFVAYGFTPLYPRPPDTSFPSATAGYFAAVTLPLWHSWRKLGLLAVAISAEVAFGCVYVGVHYLTDVAAGVAIGLACGQAAWMAVGRPAIARPLDAGDALLARLRLRPRRYFCSR